MKKNTGSGEALMRAGASITDPTPQAGTHPLGATSALGPAQFVLDPLYAKAVGSTWLHWREVL